MKKDRCNSFSLNNRVMTIAPRPPKEENSVSQSKKKVSQINLEGRFISFAGSPKKKPKQIRLLTKEGEHQIKLAKKLRSSIREILVPGDWVQVKVKKTIRGKKKKVKLKAKSVQPTTPRKPSEVFLPLETDQKPKKTKDCIMVCQKSSCCKRGATEIYQAATATLATKGLEHEVAVKGTGCMKQCKKGPCMVFMPDKSRYIGVKAENVQILIDKHFDAKVNPKPALAGQVETQE